MDLEEKENVDMEEGRDIQQARQVKAKQKMYKNAKATIKPHNIKEGDTILLQRKSTKCKSPYGPQPFRRCRALGSKGGEERRKAHIETNGEGRVCGQGGRKTEDVPH